MKYLDDEDIYRNPLRIPYPYTDEDAGKFIDIVAEATAKHGHHAYRTLLLETDRQRLLEILQQYVDLYEAELPKPCSIRQANREFFDGLLDAIAGFDIVIDRIEGRWKLNQNHDKARRANVIQARREADTEDKRQIAALMSETLED